MSTTNILDLNNRINALEKAVSGGDSAQANKADIATEFSATTNYTAGCFVYHGGKLYQFNADHSAGAWDPTDVVEANVTDQVVSNKSAIDGLTASDVAYDNTDSGLTATDVQGAVDELRQADNIMMSDGVTSVEEALDTLTDQSGSYKRGVIPPNSSVEITLPTGGRSYLLFTYADNNTYNAFSILAFFYTGIYKNISIVASTNITITDSIANRVVRLTNDTNYNCNYAIKNI